MPIEFHCSSCRCPIAQPDEQAGQSSVCPSCGHANVVSADSTVVPNIETAVMAVRPAQVPFTFEEKALEGDGPRWSCPHCAGQILENARICRYCKKAVDYLRPDNPTETRVRAHLHETMALVARCWIVLAVFALITLGTLTQQQPGPFERRNMLWIVCLLLAGGWGLSALLTWRKDSLGLLLGLFVSYGYTAGLLVIGLSPCAGLTFLPVALLILLAHTALAQESDLNGLKAVSIRGAAPSDTSDAVPLPPCPRCGEPSNDAATSCPWCATDFAQLSAQRVRAEQSFVGWTRLTVLVWVLHGLFGLLTPYALWWAANASRRADLATQIVATFLPFAWFGLALLAAARQMWGLRAGIGLSILLLTKYFLELSLAHPNIEENPIQFTPANCFEIVLIVAGLLPALIASADRAARQRLG